MTGRSVDLLIAGGGPAGLGAAIGAARAGLEVVVVEPRTTPIDKACGEGLMPGAVRALRTLEVELTGHVFDGIRYLDDQHIAQARFRHGSGLGVRRTTLHEAMTDRAHQLGIKIEQGRVSDVRQRGEFVEIDGRRARYVIAADGLHSPVRARMGLGERKLSRVAPRYGIRKHFGCEPWSNYVEVYWARHHEVYVTPVADDLVGVAVLGGERIDFEAALDDVPTLRKRLVGAEPIGSARGAGPLRQSVSARVAGRVLLVGDAGGYLDALTGEGIRLGLEESAAALRAILADDPQSYEAAWSKITSNYRRGTGALLAVSGRPALRRRLVPAAARFPGLFSRCVNALA